MAIARHSTGPTAAWEALASQIHPVFMLPPLAASWFGAILASEFALGIGSVHAFAVGLAVYTAHVKDGYVDFHARGEDDDHPLTVRGCRLALVGATIGFAGCLLVLGWHVDHWAVLLTLPGWVIGYLHAPQLDIHPLGATLGYPGGIGLAILGGHYVQTSSLSALVFAYAAVFVVVLAGVKIIDDETDLVYDRSIGKRTVAVVLGRTGARRLALASIAGGLLAVVWFSVLGVFPRSAPVAGIVFAGIAIRSHRAPPDIATKLLVRGSYLFLALLVVSVWYRPLDSV